MSMWVAKGQILFIHFFVRPLSSLFTVFYSLDPKIIQLPSSSAPPHNRHLSRFSIHLLFSSLPPSFGAVTSSRQLPRAALWRTEPGFVDMATERWDGWGPTHCERRQAHTRNQRARTWNYNQSFWFFTKGAFVALCTRGKNQKKKSWCDVGRCADVKTCSRRWEDGWRQTHICFISCECFLIRAST